MAKLLTADDHLAIQKEFRIEPTSPYAVVTSRIPGRRVKSVHVFAREPNTAEILEFEATASRVEFKGTKAKIEGSQTKAALHLYNLLILRAHNVPANRVIHAELDRAKAAEYVPLYIKKAAIRDITAGHWSEGELIEMEGDEDADDDQEGDRSPAGDGA